MAQNLATKYEKQFEAAFAPTSFFHDKVNTKYTFSGANTIRIYSPVTTELQDYVRSGANRYGQVTEMDNTLQEMVLSQDKGFTKALDRGNYDDSMMAISAANWMSEQIKGVVTPTIEKYAVLNWIKNAGKVEGISAKPTKTNVVEAILGGAQALTDAFVPEDNRYLYVTAEMFKLLSLSSEWIGIEKLGEKALAKGVLGEFAGMKVVKLPTSYLPEGCYALIARKDSILMPRKISTFKTHTNPPGIDGWLMEGRVYYDSFVLGAKAEGVYALVLTSKKQTTPTISYSSGLSITSANAEKILYTLNGADPRFCTTAKVYSGTPVLSAGKYEVRAVAYGGTSTPFTSDVASETITVS